MKAAQKGRFIALMRRAGFRNPRRRDPVKALPPLPSFQRGERFCVRRDPRVSYQLLLKNVLRAGGILVLRAARRPTSAPPAGRRTAGGPPPQPAPALCMTHMSRSNRYDTSSHSVMDTAHRSSRPPGGRARRSVLRHNQHASATVPGVRDARGAGGQPACRHPRRRRQVLAVVDGAPAGRLTHRLARRPPLRPTPRRSMLPRRVVRAKALPDRVQAPPGLSSSTPSAAPRRQTSPAGAATA